MKKIKQILAAALLFCAFSAFADTATNVLKLGHITVENGVAKYKNATVTGSGGVSAISVHVDKGSIITTDIGTPNYTDTLTAHQTGIWTYSPALTTSEAQSKVTSLSFNYVEGMTITIDVDSNTISIPSGVAVTQFTPEVVVACDANGNSTEVEIPNSGGTPHYYMFVPYDTSATVGNWTDAYNAAKGWTFLGMKGYLATITSAAEDGVLDAITTLGGWAGAARIKTTGTASSLDADTCTNIYVGGATNAVCAWSWVCGPEAGYGIRTPSTAGGHTTADPQAKAYVPYAKWLSQTGQPDGTTDTGEAYFQVHFGGNWNDLPITYTTWCKGYFVEFSDYKKVSGYKEPASVALQSCQVYDTTNGQDYSSIAEAVANADSGDILQLMADQVVSEQDTEGKKLVINTNGHKITGSFAVSSGSFTINAEDAKVDLTALKVSGGEFTIEKITCGTVTVTGGKLAINGTKDTVSLAKAAVSGGEFTLKGATFASTDKITSNVLVEGGTFTVDGLVTIPSLTLAQGNKVVFGENADNGSEITLSSTLPTGIITENFPGALGGVISLPSGVTDYLLIKTKTGELKIKQHKSAW